MAILSFEPIGAAWANHSPTHFVVRYEAPNYVAQSTGPPYTGTLKTVVEAAVADLKAAGGGTVTFQAGLFDLGSDYLRLEYMTDITIEGAGMGATTIKNSSDADKDTEPFNTLAATRVVIQDLTVEAGGIPRTHSDAIDFDQGNDSLVQRVRITDSRGKGIIFDGKDGTWTSEGNVVRNCEISGTANDGIQFLASSNNRVENCSVHDTGGDGISAIKSPADAAQPNKKSNDNAIVGNTVDKAGENGIRIHSSDRNLVFGNTITNSSKVVANQDGIRITAGTESITCDDNRVEQNVATDNQGVKTQRYGLNITSSLCNRTFVWQNNFAGNLAGEIRDMGTNTQYAPDTQPPTAPTNLQATAASSSRVDLSWGPSTDNLVVTAYDVYRNGSPLVSLGAVTAFSDSTVAPSTQYQYQVRARDPSGNASAFSNVATVKTPTTAAGATGSPPLCKGRVATLWGTAGSDTLAGTSARDVIVGRGGADTIKGLGGNDLICAGAGADKIFGGLGNDHILGGTGSDAERGGKGRDRLVGGKGKDTCAGGPGKDTAVGCELGPGP